jgi:hypothetical protein
MALPEVAEDAIDLQAGSDHQAEHAYGNGDQAEGDDSVGALGMGIEAGVGFRRSTFGF